ncbi:glycosyl transferase family 1 [Pseudorhizobium pelagicum]|uniref:Glycosyl transferase family 1 n=1 Tax=Pseudorhizobium pelagicum TaxID=1509405 RepID=A0A922T9I9_9HYPH|nr:glycosyl transferase family 1 [Pseudorhizobium pelagicum]KEQ02867.1 glycosyl transferase family 1 [Pseudorhizobium pelagicum]
MRVLFHVPGLGGGGAERVVVLLANEMVRRGLEVVLLVWNKDGPNLAMLNPTVRLISFDSPMDRGGFGKLGTFQNLLRTVRVVYRLRPDAVFSALDFANSLIALALFCARSKAAFFPSYHSASALKAEGTAYSIPLLDRLTAARATKAISVSTGVARDLVDRGFRRPKVMTIHNPVPAQARQRPEPYPWELELARMGNGPVIAALGRLVEVKDHATLLEAFHALDRNLDCRLAIFGDGPLEASLREHADRLGISGRVLFTGYVNDPGACYAAADLVVSTSRSEGFGNVLVEALAAGLPIVSTDAPHGPREILADGEFGSLVPVGDAQAIAKALHLALISAKTTERLMGRARAFSVERIGDQYEALLKDHCQTSA